MATVRFLTGLEDVMVVTGADVYDMSREELTAFMDGASTTPKVYREGLYDFAVLWWDGRSGNASHRGYDGGAKPRPMRGRVYMPGVPNTSGGLAGDMYLLAHEVLHHWIVSPSMEVRGTPALRSADFVAAAAMGVTRFEQPPMFGRADSHWSPYWQSDDSYMDGTRFTVGPKLGFLRRWDAAEQPAVSVTVPGGPTVTTNTQFSDLDLFGMGAKTAAECYGDDNNRFRWMEPRYVGPLNHRMGVMVAVRSSAGASTYEFGFERDYDRLVVARDNSVVVQRTIPSFDPFTFNRGMLLRVVYDGNALQFQARKDDRGAAGCRRLIQTIISRRRRDADPFDPYESLASPASPDFRGWETVHSVAAPADDIVVGLSAQRSASAWVDLGFRDVHLKALDDSRLESPGVPSGAARTTMGAWLSGWADWPEFEGRVFLPSPGAQVRDDGDGTTHLMLPHRLAGSATFPADSFSFKPPTKDGGARILWKAPANGMAFVASVAPHSVLVAPWIGGGMRDKYLLGVEHIDPVSEVTFRPGHAEKRVPPPDDTYRIAHIIVGAAEADITQAKVEAVDLRRRAFDLYFEAATEGRRRMDSRLEDSP